MAKKTLAQRLRDMNARQANTIRELQDNLQATGLSWSDDVQRLAQERDGANQAAVRARADRDEATKRAERAETASTQNFQSYTAAVQAARRFEKDAETNAKALEQAKETLAQTPRLATIAQRLEQVASRMETQAVRQESPVVQGAAEITGTLDCTFTGLDAECIRGILSPTTVAFYSVDHRAYYPAADDPIRDHGEMMVKSMYHGMVPTNVIIDRLLDELALAKTVARAARAEATEERRKRPDPKVVRRARIALNEIASALHGRLSGYHSRKLVDCARVDIEKALPQ